MTRVEQIKKYAGFGGLFVIALCTWIACSDNGTNNNTSNSSSASTPAEETTAYPQGKTIYQKTCIACHGTDGSGSIGTYPPLAKSDFLLADKYRAIHQVLKGSSAKYTVNGNDYQGVMPPQDLSDEDIANVLNYVYHAWGNNGFTVAASDVKAVRDTIKK